jgi:transcriptional regulator with XRE-family HTH domain
VIRGELAGAYRDARLAAGLPQRAVAEAVGLSVAEVSRIERDDAPWLRIDTAARLASVLGLDLWTRTYPGDDRLRDAGHARLFHALLRDVGPEIGALTEVPVTTAPDQRAWDVVLRRGDESVVAELETRITDAQALVRRLELKKRDGDRDVVILVVADRRSNRRAIRAAGSVLRPAFPADSRTIRAALRSGRLPSESGMLFVPIPG